MSLYLLLLEERYGHPLDMGLLWYLNEQARCCATTISPRPDKQIVMKIVLHRAASAALCRCCCIKESLGMKPVRIHK